MLYKGCFTGANASLHPLVKTRTDKQNAEEIADTCFLFLPLSGICISAFTHKDTHYINPYSIHNVF